MFRVQFAVVGRRVYRHRESQIEGEAHAAGGVALDGRVAAPLGELAHREPVGCLAGSSVRWLVGSFVRWLVGSFVRWLVGWLVGWLVD